MRIHVERALGNGEYERIAIIDADTETYEDLDLPAGPVKYRLMALGSASRSAYSNIAAVSYPSTR